MTTPGLLPTSGTTVPQAGAARVAVAVRVVRAVATSYGQPSPAASGRSPPRGQVYPRPTAGAKP